MAGATLGGESASVMRGVSPSSAKRGGIDLVICTQLLGQGDCMGIVDLRKTLVVTMMFTMMGIIDGPLFEQGEGREEEEEEVVVCIVVRVTIVIVMSINTVAPMPHHVVRMDHSPQVVAHQAVQCD